MTKDDFLDSMVEYYADRLHFTDEELEAIWAIHCKYAPSPIVEENV